MNRSKFSFLITASLVAVLLTFASLAQAGKGGEKGPNPGGDNPGSTGEPIPFHQIGFIPLEFDSCWDHARWCRDRDRECTDAVIGGTGDYYANAKACAWAFTDCDADSYAIAGALGIYGGKGEFLMRRHGQNGAMHHIDLDVVFGSGLLYFAKAGAFADTLARAGAGVRAFVKGEADLGPDFDINGFCEDEPRTDEPFIREFCAWAKAGGMANGGAMASSYGSGWGSIAGGSIAGMDVWNSVYASNIELYHTVTSASSGGFLLAQGSAMAGAMSTSYVNAFMKAYAEICDGYYPILGFQEICSESSARARARAHASASAWTSARADAFALMTADFKMKAVYYNADGNVDKWAFDGEINGNGYSDGVVRTSCRASP